MKEEWKFIRQEGRRWFAGRISHGENKACKGPVLREGCGR